MSCCDLFFSGWEPNALFTITVNINITNIPVHVVYLLICIVKVPANWKLWYYHHNICNARHHKYASNTYMKVRVKSQHYHNRPDFYHYVKYLSYRRVSLINSRLGAHCFTAAGLYCDLASLSDVSSVCQRSEYVCNAD